MKNYTELTHFAGLDWAKDHHDATSWIGRARWWPGSGSRHSGPGWQQWREKIHAYSALGVAIEPVTERRWSNCWQAG